MHRAWTDIHRSIKQRAFAAHFGWWQPRELLELRGRLEELGELFLRPDSLLADAVAEEIEADRRTAALFDMCEEDDFSD